MKTYLFTWNSSLYREGDDEMVDYSKMLEKGESTIDRWSCTSLTEKGGRAFLYHSGDQLKGIFASGLIITDPYRDKHWNSKAKHKETWYVDYEIDKLVYPLDESILTLEQLKKIPGFFVPRQSGVQLNENVAFEIEKLWLDVKTRFVKKNTDSITLPQELPGDKSYPEGYMTKRYVNAYERNPQARKECIDYYGWQCQICGFDFETVYGPKGNGIIEVHHIVPMSKIKKGYQVNPVNDLIPVCSNCHAMLHSKAGNEVFSPEEVKEMIVVPVFDFPRSDQS